MKKIGIITTSNAINYGAVLQAFALKKSLQAVFNGEVEIINYCGSLRVTGREYYRENTSIKNLIYNLVSFMNFAYKRNRKRLINKFDDFKRASLELNDHVLYTKEEIEKSMDYDTLVCGSDQIWNLNLYKDDVFFLRFEENYPDIKYCSYAASIAESMTEEQEKYISKSISHFDLLSVRETASIELVENLSNKKVQLVTDPVYLLDSVTWNSIISGIKNRFSEKYTLVFMIGHSKSDQIIVDKICNDSGFKVVVIELHPLRYIKGDYYVFDASPLEFVSLIKNAEMIITDSFHATSFSIIFNKEFYTVPRGKRNSRTENLFDMFGLEKRYVTYDTTIKRKQIPYKDVNDKIKIQRDISFAYLEQIVGE